MLKSTLTSLEGLLPGASLRATVRSPVGTGIQEPRPNRSEIEQRPGVSDELVEQVNRCPRRCDHFGRLDPPWGSVNRLRRGAIDIPIAGGPDVLRAIYGREQTNDGRLTAVAGDGLMIFAEWAADGTPRLRTRHNFGSASTRPRSPHYADQAEAFAGETLRTVTWDRAVLEAQTTTRTRLTATP